MAWSTSDRKLRLPSNWNILRNQVLSRDSHECQWEIGWGSSVEICGRRATDVDHVIAGDDHSLVNLRALCREHHQLKSSREGAQAYWNRRREISKRYRRKPERHPGSLDSPD